jgi:predicted N-acetyltransferase YhbS
MLELFPGRSMLLAMDAVVRVRPEQLAGTAPVRELNDAAFGRTVEGSVVAVIGHPDFYPPFGFQPATRFGLRCQWPAVPEPAFMVLELRPAALQGVSGVARYPREFDEAV